jgi:DNA polymerase-3 subunit delta
MSTIETYRKLKKEVAEGKLRPVYLLHGEEGLFIDRIADEIVHTALAEHERDFNLTVLYGKDCDPDQVRDAALRFPMMAERQVVMVRELQTWRIDQVEKLVPYIQKPAATTVLVLCYKHKKVDGRRGVIKAVQKGGGAVFTSDRMRDHELPAWIGQLVRHYKRRIGETEANLLAAHLGNDLGKVVGEVEKLCLVTEEGGTITAELIQRMVGISKDFNIFELQKALAGRDAAKAQRIAQYYAQAPRDHPFVLTLGQLNNWFAKVSIAHQFAGKGQAELASALKVSPFFVREYTAAARAYPPGKLVEIQHMLAHYDVRSKGLGGSSPEGDLLRELLARIMA